jgi:hypothetical protein
MILRIIYWILDIKKSEPFQLKERKHEPPAPGFYEWCKEFKVGILHNKNSYFPD